MYAIAEYVNADGHKVYQARKFKEDKPDKATVDRVLSKLIQLNGATNSWAVKSKPTLRMMENAVDNMACRTIVCGCKVELDGECSHGRPSVMRAFGMI